MLQIPLTLSVLIMKDGSFLLQLTWHQPLQVLHKGEFRFSPSFSCSTSFWYSSSPSSSPPHFFSLLQLLIWKFLLPSFFLSLLPFPFVLIPVPCPLLLPLIPSPSSPTPPPLPRAAIPFLFPAPWKQEKTHGNSRRMLLRHLLSTPS